MIFTHPNGGCCLGFLNHQQDDFHSWNLEVWISKVVSIDWTVGRGSPKRYPNCFALTKGPKWSLFWWETQGGFFCTKSKPRRAGTTFLCCPFVNWKQDCFVNSLASSIALILRHTYFQNDCGNPQLPGVETQSKAHGCNPWGKRNT